MKLKDSKIMAWCAMVLVIAVTVMTGLLRTEWWTYIPVFFAFMMSFFHLLAVYMRRIPQMSRTLDVWALAFGVLMIVGIIGVYAAEAAIFDL